MEEFKYMCQHTYQVNSTQNAVPSGKCIINVKDDHILTLIEFSVIQLHFLQPKCLNQYKTQATVQLHY